MLYIFQRLARISNKDFSKGYVFVLESRKMRSTSQDQIQLDFTCDNSHNDNSMRIAADFHTIGGVL